jgi:hypothetical protein
VSNPARAKGTKWETALLPRLRALFGDQVERAPLKGVHDHGDFLGVPFLHEAKSTQKPLFQAWARICEVKAGKAWCVLWKGDGRSKTGNGPYVLMPLELYELLVDASFHPQHHSSCGYSDGDDVRMLRDDINQMLPGGILS